MQTTLRVFQFTKQMLDAKQSLGSSLLVVIQVLTQQWDTGLETLCVQSPLFYKQNRQFIKTLRIFLFYKQNRQFIKTLCVFLFSTNKTGYSLRSSTSNLLSSTNKTGSSLRPWCPSSLLQTKQFIKTLCVFSSTNKTGSSIKTLGVLPLLQTKQFIKTLCLLLFYKQNRQFY